MIRARKWIIIISMCVVTVTALAATAIQKPAYEAQAEITLFSTDAGAAIVGAAQGAQSSQSDLSTQVRLMQRRELAQTVVAELGLAESPEALLRMVKVDPVGMTNNVTITAVDSDPQRAANIANALASAYVAWSRENARGSIAAAAAQVQERLAQTKREIVALDRSAERAKKARKNSVGATDSVLPTELASAKERYATLAERLDTLKVNEQLDIGPARVSSVAFADSTAVSPKPLRNGAIGLAIGLAVGLGIAYVLERLDDTDKLA